VASPKTARPRAAGIDIQPLPHAGAVGMEKPPSPTFTPHETCLVANVIERPGMGRRHAQKQAA